MAHNDHRIMAENDDFKLEITVKNAIHPEHNLLDIKEGDELDDLFDGGNDDALRERNSALGNRVDELTTYMNDAEKTNKKLRTDLETASHQINFFQQANTDLQAKVATLEADKKHTDVLESKVLELQTEIEILSKKKK